MVSNPYSVLGISISSSYEEARASYRRLVKLYHPDVGGDVAKFREVQEAWKLLESLGDRAFGRRVGRLSHRTLFTFRRV